MRSLQSRNCRDPKAFGQSQSKHGNSHGLNYPVMTNFKVYPPICDYSTLLFAILS